MSFASPSARPLVSIVTPTLNMGDRLERCIASVRAQTYSSIEHIVLDACSTDGTVDLLQRTEGIRWVSEPDRGQSDAINKGLRMATGDVLGWLNADDELVPTTVENVVAALARRPEAGLVYGDIELVENGVRTRVPPSGEFSADAMWRGNTISQPGTFWTRWAQAIVGDLDEDFHLTMDYELWLRFARARIPALYLPEVVARFEVHEASKTGTAGTLAFVEEEARALRKHGETHGAVMAIDRWYWSDIVRQVGEAALAGRGDEAAAIARRSLPRMTPLRSRTRWFLWLAAVSPRLAGSLYRRGQREP